jgi:hypothetical protein
MRGVGTGPDERPKVRSRIGAPRHNITISGLDATHVPLPYVRTRLSALVGKKLDVEVRLTEGPGNVPLL